MSKELNPIQAFINHLIKELTEAGLGLNFYGRTDSPPTTVSHPVAQIFPLTSEFEGFGMGGRSGVPRFMETAIIAIEIFTPLPGKKVKDQPVLALDWKVKKWLAKNINKRPPAMPEGTSFKSAFIRRADYRLPYSDLKNIDFVQLQFELQITEAFS